MTLVAAIFMSGLTPVAEAGPITDCYIDANNDHSGLSLNVIVNGSTILTTTNTAEFFQTIAENYDESTLDASGNTAGKNAVKQAIECVWDAEFVTLSSLWVNERVAQMQAKSVTIDIDLPNGGTTTMSFQGMGVPCGGDLTDAFVFTDGASTFSLDASSHGTYDWKAPLSIEGAKACERYLGCTGGRCLGESSSTPPYTTSCTCDLTGQASGCTQYDADSIATTGTAVVGVEF